MSTWTARIFGVGGPLLFLASLAWLAFGGGGPVWHPIPGIGALTLMLLSVWLSVRAWKALARRPRRTAPLVSTPSGSTAAALTPDLPAVSSEKEASHLREVRAREPLGEEDEEVALELAQLSDNLANLDRQSQAALQCARMIREMGQVICAKGGFERMDLICYRVHYLCGTSRYVRRNWNGICGWEY